MRERTTTTSPSDPLSECSAVLDLVDSLPGATEQQDKLRRIGAMLAKLRR